MRIGIVGAGRIGGNAGRLFAGAGHEVMFSGSRDPAKLEQVAAEAGGARTGSPREAVEFANLLMFSVPWRAIDDVLAQTGSLDGKVVIDTTNQYGPDGWEDLGERTAAQLNAARVPGAGYVKSFNTLTSGFQAEAAERTGDERVALFLCGDDAGAKSTAAGLIEDAGFVPVDVGGTADAAVMEAPRRDGAVYGEEYREPEARAVVDALRAGKPIPPTPSY